MWRIGGMNNLAIIEAYQAAYHEQYDSSGESCENNLESSGRRAGIACGDYSTVAGT